MMPTGEEVAALCAEGRRREVERTETVAVADGFQHIGMHVRDAQMDEEVRSVDLEVADARGAHVTLEHQIVVLVELHHQIAGTTGTRARVGLRWLATGGRGQRVGRGLEHREPQLHFEGLRRGLGPRLLTLRTRATFLRTHHPDFNCGHCTIEGLGFKKLFLHKFLLKFKIYYSVQIMIKHLQIVRVCTKNEGEKQQPARNKTH